MFAYHFLIVAYQVLMISLPIEDSQNSQQDVRGDILGLLVFACVCTQFYSGRCRVHVIIGPGRGLGSANFIIRSGCSSVPVGCQQ